MFSPFTTTLHISVKCFTKRAIIFLTVLKTTLPPNNTLIKADMKFLTSNILVKVMKISPERKEKVQNITCINKRYQNLKKRVKVRSCEHLA